MAFYAWMIHRETNKKNIVVTGMQRDKNLQSLENHSTSNLNIYEK